MLRLQANVRVADVLESQVRVRITSIEVANEAASRATRWSGSRSNPSQELLVP